jgi:hypothetical protein
MRYGHYSENEFKKIKLILVKYSVIFTESVDQKAIDGINESMEDNLRHYHGATICNDVIVFDMDETEWKKIPQSSYDELRELRVFSAEDMMSEEDFDALDSEPDTADLRRAMDDSRTMGLGKTFLLINIIGVSFYFIIQLVK